MYKHSERIPGLCRLEDIAFVSAFAFMVGGLCAGGLIGCAASKPDGYPTQINSQPVMRLLSESPELLLEGIVHVEANTICLTISLQQQWTRKFERIQPVQQVPDHRTDLFQGNSGNTTIVQGYTTHTETNRHPLMAKVVVSIGYGDDSVRHELQTDTNGIAKLDIADHVRRAYEKAGTRAVDLDASCQDRKWKLSLVRDKLHELYRELN